MVFFSLAVLIQTLAGAPIDALAPPAGVRILVYIFTSTDCPISNRYAPDVRRLAAKFANDGVRFRLVYPARGDTESAIRAHVSAFSYTEATEALRDPDLALAKFTGATIAPEAVVIVNGKVVYRGRIDDRYVAVGVDRPAAQHDLADAIAAAVAGRPVRTPVTPAVGCYIADLAR